MKTRVTNHGIEFIRSGKCLQCGACGCKECTHNYEQDGLIHCLIYEWRAEPCLIPCSQTDNDGTHSNCIGYPDSPWIRPIRSGVCGYSFERADGGSMDDLPFLDGKPYHGDNTRQ